MMKNRGQAQGLVMNDIKAVLFDFGGTLDHDGTDWFTRFYELVSGKINGLDRAVFDKCAESAAAAITALPDTGTLLMDQTAHRLSEHLHREMQKVGLGNWQADEVGAAFVADARSYLERNLNMLEELGGIYRLGCISNNWGNTAGWCRQFGFDSLFETMVDSAVVNSIKPDAKIFKVALGELNLPAEQCVYVGDRFDYDMEGASVLGMKTAWVVGQGKEWPAGGQPSAVTWQVPALNMLPEILGQSSGN